MRKNAAALCALIGLIGFASAAQATLTVTWTYAGNFFTQEEFMYDHNASAVAHPTDGTAMVQLYSTSESFANMLTHMNNAANFDPIGNSTAHGSASPWTTGGDNMGAATGSAQFESSAGGFVGDLFYFYLLDPGSAHSGFIMNSGWVVPDDTIPPPTNLEPGRLVGDAGTTGTLPGGGATDGWATTNVPEPGSIMLFAAGLAAIVLRKRLKS